MNKNRLFAYITLGTTVVVVLFLMLWLPPQQEAIAAFSKANPLWAPLAIIISRIIGMVIPPIPGGLVSFALIPVIGWFWAYIYGVIGTTTGAIIAFLLARKFREPLVARFVPLQQMHSWEARISHKKKFWAFLLIRMTTGPLMDFVSYIAGLTKISFLTFLVTTLIAEIPTVLVYYIGGKTYEKFSGTNNYAGVGFLLLLGILFYFFKDHEIFTGKKKTT